MKKMIVKTVGTFLLLGVILGGKLEADSYTRATYGINAHHFKRGVDLNNDGQFDYYLEKKESETLDFNGDGKADLMVVDSAGHYLNPATQRADCWAVSYPNLPYVYAYTEGDLSPQKPNVFFGDFDADGKTDTMSWSGDYNNTFRVTTAVGKSFILAQHRGNYAAAVGDFNGDGKSDVLAIDKDSNKYYVTTSSGTGPLNTYLWVHHGGNFSAYEWKLGDLNGDGKTDLVLRVKARGDSAAGNFYVTLGRDVNEPTRIYGGDSGGLDKFRNENFPWSLGDFDGDGTDDIIAFVPGGGDYGDAVFWVVSITKGGHWYRYADRTYTSWVHDSAAVSFTYFVNGEQYVYVYKFKDYFPSVADWKVADVDDDGKDDLIVAAVDKQTNQNIFWLFTGPNVAQVFQVHKGGPYEWEVGDMDGDGNKDLVYVDQNNDFYVTTSPGRVDAFWTYYETGVEKAYQDGALHRPTLWANYEGTLNEKQWDLADFTGDGKDELMFYSLKDGQSIRSGEFYLTYGANQTELYLSKYLDTINNQYRLLPYRWYARNKVHEVAYDSGRALSDYNEVHNNIRTVPGFYSQGYAQAVEKAGIAPDLKGWSEPSFSVKEQEAIWGENIHLNFSVYNNSERDAAPFTVRFYFSADEHIGDENDVPFVEVRQALGLPGYSLWSISDEDGFTVKLPTENPLTGSPSTIYIGMVVDANNDVNETEEENNSNQGSGLDSDSVSVSDPLPDLRGWDGRGDGHEVYFDVEEGEAEWGSVAHVRFGVYNDSYGAAGAFKVKFYLSKDENIGTEDVALDFAVDVEGLEGKGFFESNGGYVPVRLPNFNPFGAGVSRVYIGMIVDTEGQVNEVNEGNNSNQGVLLDKDSLGVKDPLPDLRGWDGRSLGHEEDYFEVKEEEGVWGSAVQVRFSVLNDSYGAAGKFKVRFYLSDDEQIDSNDIVLGEDQESGGLEAGGVFRFAGGGYGLVRLPVVNPYGESVKEVYVGMVVDADKEVEESDEGNNSNGGERIDVAKLKVKDALPDLRGWDGRGSGHEDYFDVKEEEAIWGSKVQLRFSVLNDSAGKAGAFRVRFYLSGDNIIGDDKDVELEVPLVRSGGLEGGGVFGFNGGYASVSLPGSNPLAGSPEEVYVGMVVDSEGEVSESNEGNNKSQGVGKDLDKLRVKEAKADLLGWEDRGKGVYFDVKEEEVKWGDPLSIKFGIRNNGYKKSGGFKVRFYVSVDEKIGDEGDVEIPAVLRGGVVSNGAGVDKGGTWGVLGGHFRLLRLPEENPFVDSGEAFYVGMVVDADGEVEELDEGNNASLGAGIDLDSLKIREPKAELKISGEVSEGEEGVVMDFGKVGVDGEGGMLGMKGVEVANIGDGELEIHSVRIEGDEAFRIVEGEDQASGKDPLANLPEMIEGEGKTKWMVRVEYDPYEVKESKARLVIVSSVGEEIVELRGVGEEAPKLVVKDSSGAEDDLKINYGYEVNDGIGGREGRESITVSNEGSGGMKIEGIEVSGGGAYRIVSIRSDKQGAIDLSNGGVMLEAWGSEKWKIVVVFDPVEVGAFTGEVRIRSAEGEDGVVKVELRGKGFKAISKAVGSRGREVHRNGTEERVDFNGDGKSDLIAVDQQDNFWISVGEGEWHLLQQYEEDLRGEYQWGLGDFDGDGKSDLLVVGAMNDYWVTYGGSGGRQLFFDGGGTLEQHEWGLGDFDGDGRTDLIVANYINDYWVVEADGKGEAYLYAEFEGRSYNYQWGLGDFNGDGRSDLMVVTSANDYWVVESGGGGKRLFFDGGGRLSDHQWGLGDFNGDGKSDLMVANGNNDYWVKESGPEEVYLYQDYAGHLKDHEWGLGDFNGDNVTDLIVVNKQDGYRVNLRAGEWILYKKYEGEKEQWELGDFDGNGTSDLAVLNEEGVLRIKSSLEGEAEVYENYGRKLEELEWDTGDFDGDGRVDIMVFFKEEEVFWVTEEAGVSGLYQDNSGVLKIQQWAVGLGW